MDLASVPANRAGTLDHQPINAPEDRGDPGIVAESRIVHRSGALNVSRVLRHWARDRAERPAIWLSGQALDYAALNRWVDIVADDLRRRGIRPGDRIGFYAETSIEWCVAVFGAIRCGAIVAPINSRMIAAEVDHLFGRYEPVLIFADPPGEERLREWGLIAAPGKPAIISRAAIAALRDHAPVAPVICEIDPDAPIAIITTSGSTARPKGVVYTHRSMIDYALEETSDIHADLSGETVGLFSPSPLSTAGGFNLLVHSVVTGMSIYMLERFEPGDALALLAAHPVNTFRGSPLFFDRIAAHPAFASATFDRLRIATVGGAAPTAALLETWRAKGVVLRQLYGQTEGGGALTVNPSRFALSDPDRCGYGAPFTEIAIVDEQGQRVPPDTPGEIIARGAGMMIGYWRDPQATAKALVNGWLHTGDIGVVDSRGLLRMVDRVKDFIKSGGFNISSAELERVISEVDGVLEVAIIAVPDATFGETPFAIVHGPGTSAEAILAHCRTQLSSFKLPRYVAFSAEPLPRLAMGKISKPALRREWAERPLPAPIR